MKKVLSFLALAFICNIVIGQSLDDVRKLMLLNKTADAKVSIDKYFADPKNAAKADGWYYKGAIYNDLAKTEVTAKFCTNCRLEAFEAFKKYQALEPKNTLMNEEENVRLFDIYNGFFDLGAKNYNAKDYAGAFENFKNTGLVGDYITSKGFSYKGFKFPPLDTSLTQNTALAARLAKNDEMAAKYYEKLVGINMHSDNELDMYQFLVEYYARSKNKPAYEAVIKKAKGFYPTNEYWNEMELDQIDRKDKAVLFAKYEQLIAENKTNYTLSFNYCAELFNHVYVSDPKPSDFAAARAKLVAAIKSTIAIKNSPDANLLMAKCIYNDTYDAQEEINKIKGPKPADVKLRAEKKAAMMKMADECIKYADAAIAEFANTPNLKPSAKANYKNCYNLQESMYSLKGNAAKAAEVKKKSEAL
jgi:hypothetical protein